MEMASVLGAAIAKRDSTPMPTISASRSIRSHWGNHWPGQHRHAPLILGAFLHDVGKIGISDNILLQPGKLTDEEFAVMRTHVNLGA